MKLGEKIRFFRNKASLSKKQLAGMIRVSEETLEQYESEKVTPKADLLIEISHRLRVSPLYFFDWDDKSLLLFPMDYESFQNWCQTIQQRYNRPFLDVQFFEYSMKSDRYFMELNQRYLVRLKDGFYFIPILSKWYAGKQYQVLDLEQMRKMLNEDILFTERELRKPYLFRLDQDIFAKEIYVSKYDRVDPIYLSDEEEVELFEIATRCNQIIGYNERLQVFYLLETNGINQIPLAETLTQGILNERKIYLNVKAKKLLTVSEVKQLQFYVLNEEEYVRRIARLLEKNIDSKAEKLGLNSSNVLDNVEQLEAKNNLHETDHNAIAHFLRARYWALDNIKRILYLTEEVQDSIFEDEWEIKQTVNSMKKDASTSSEKKDLSILLAEDSAFMRSVYLNILNRHFSCEIEEAKDGEMALTMFEESKKKGKKYDLIILDITMPKIDGFTLLRQIIKRDSEATIVMCSSVTNKKIVMESIRNGAKHFITKPIEERNMVDIIRKVLDKK